MFTIKEIFGNKLFRIPDYQRGYSWEKSHLDDFWQDILNLQYDKVHYTGMISVEAVDEKEYSKWTDDEWLIRGKGDVPYFIVDGQQRLTTIIILIWVIADRLEQGMQISYENKQNIHEKYIVTINEAENKKSYLFGYHKDNPSYEFLKQEIFEQKGNSDSILEETAYTNNLLYAKKYFTDKIKRYSTNDLSILYDKVTKRLKFDFRILEKELDIFIVFETMNNRGKPLSNLEKLKNRLIYLSTLLKDGDEHLRLELRENINTHWKIIYKYLGLNKERRLDDDSFLQNHWIMFKRYERREPEFYATDLFEKYFTSQNVLSGAENFDTITKYITSISESAKQWFVMNNPSHSHAYELASSRGVLEWLEKINRLGFKSFAPLVMGSLVKEKDSLKLIRLFKAIEAYIFLIFDVSFRRSNTGTYHFYAKASELYNSEIDLDAVIDDIDYWSYGNEDYKGYYDINSFYAYLKDLFSREHGNGYFDWKYLRYFLYEYELYLQNDSGKELKGWAELNSVQYIYPPNPSNACWKMQFKRFNKQERKNIQGSLGNFMLSYSRSINQDLCFDEKRTFYSEFANSKALFEIDEWNETTILARGLDMLNFMEKRWNIIIGTDEYKQKLLFMEFDDILLL
ncbi:Protein of unknown function DUF262 [Pedobacter terrae]|uniref:GmrSD restriction endonucleases N-terminal domain-containing protein n=1 Tax=Pedobacter terrae TaxID=405671 RepID=A0A1G7VJZ0_9SPHI|nr:DUF262 domain-containing protein [Pedobacter terrae]SDG59719.1 Protein of unknown function DUF262 [Pedobacter terrae]